MRTIRRKCPHSPHEYSNHFGEKPTSDTTLRGQRGQYRPWGRTALTTIPDRRLITRSPAGGTGPPRRRPREGGHARDGPEY